MNTTPDTFKIKALAKDRDALVLLGISLVLVLLLLSGLAFLSDAQWERLVSRSKLLWAAALAAAPALLALYARFKLREAAVTAMGAAATTVTTGPAGNAPAGVTKAGR